MSVMSQLCRLESVGLIPVTQVVPGLQYFFRHTLVQAATYASLLTSGACTTQWAGRWGTSAPTAAALGHGPRPTGHCHGESRR